MNLVISDNNYFAEIQTVNLVDTSFIIDFRVFRKFDKKRVRVSKLADIFGSVDVQKVGIKNGDKVGAEIRSRKLTRDERRQLKRCGYAGLVCEFLNEEI